MYASCCCYVPILSKKGFLLSFSVNALLNADLNMSLIPLKHLKGLFLLWNSSRHLQKPQVINILFNIRDSYNWGWNQTVITDQHPTVGKLLVTSNTKQNVLQTGFQNLLHWTMGPTYPEIDHPVVQPGVLVDSSSAFLRANKNKSPFMKYSSI